MTTRKEAVNPAAGIRQGQTIWLYAVVLTLTACAALPALAASGRFIAHNPRLRIHCKEPRRREPVGHHRGQHLAEPPQSR